MFKKVNRIIVVVLSALIILAAIVNPEEVLPILLTMGGGITLIVWAFFKFMPSFFTRHAKKIWKKIL